MHASRGFSEYADLFRRHRRIVDKGRLERNNPDAIAKHNESCRRIAELQKDLNERWKAAGLNLAALEKFESIVDAVITTSSGVFAPEISAEQSVQSYLRYLQNSASMYEGAVVIVKELNREISEQAPPQAVFPDTKQLLIVALLLNVALGIAVAYIVLRGITRPIAALANDCDALLSAQIIKAPKAVKNEIGELELTFHQLSVIENKNEIARKSYLQHLQDVQTAAISGARKTIHEIFKAKELTESAKSQFEKMSRNLDGMLLLLQQMTDAINFNLNKEPDLILSSVNTRQITTSAAGSADWLLKRKNITLTGNDGGVDIEADAALVERVVTNLLSNAVKFSKSGSTIELSAKREESGVRFEVTDHGPGISNEDQKKLFQKFSQVGANEEQRSGSGLGLLISKQIVSGHGGEIGCHSEIGKGSTFWFSIPLSPRVKSAAAPAASRQDEMEKEPKTSITNRFIILFAVFLIGQGVVAWKLSGNLDHAKETSAQYAREKRVTVRTQELLASFLSWRQKAAEAIGNRRFQSTLLLLPQLEELIDSSRKLDDAVIYSPTLYRIMLDATNQLKNMDKMAKSIDVSDPAHLPRFEQQYASADLSAQAVEDALFAALAHEGKEVHSSYDLASKVRQELLMVLGIAVLFNLSLLAATTLLGRQIINRIGDLNKKARDFALGKTLVADRDGSDELDRLDRSLCRAAETIRESEAQRINLMAMINHDLRTPLSSLLNGLEMISEGVCGILPDHEEKLASDVEKTLRKLLSQINDLLDVEKFAAGDMTLQSEETAIAELMPVIVEKARLQQLNPKVRLALEIEPEAKQLTAKIDPAMFERLIDVLIKNAVAAAPSESVVDVALSSREKTMLIRVSDKGTGIPASLQSTIFDRFRHIGDKPITGLGLPLAHYISEAMGAKLSFKTTGSGTSFAFEFPASR